ncbi:MAG: hypothetical protein ACP5FX_01940, partial [Candidatus Micrarchaeia archaeon]
LPKIEKISEITFNNTFLSAIEAIGNKIFVTSYYNPKVYEIENGKIVNEFLLNASYPSRIYSYKDDIIILTLNSSVFIYNTSSNLLSTFNFGKCEGAKSALVYNNLLYISCFFENKTMVIDLNTKTLKDVLNIPGFYISNFSNRIFEVLPRTKQIAVIDPSTNSIIKLLNFTNFPLVVG